METSNTNAPKKKVKINALMIVGVVLMFAGGPLVAPAKYIVEAIGLVIMIVGWIKFFKANKAK